MFSAIIDKGSPKCKRGGGSLVKERFLIFTNFVIPSLIQKIAKLPNLGINPEPKAKHQQRHYRPKCTRNICLQTCILESRNPWQSFPESYNFCFNLTRAPQATKPPSIHVTSPKVKQPIHPSSRNWPLKCWLCFLVELKLGLLITRSRSSSKSDIWNLKIHIMFPSCKRSRK